MPRYFVKFPEPTMRMDATVMLDADHERYRPHYSEIHDRVVVADLSDEHRKAAEKNGAKIYEDIQFYPTSGINPFEFRNPSFAYWDAAADVPAAAPFGPGAAALPVWQKKTLHDVLDHIGAPKVWSKARGKGVTIGIVDTGIASRMREFPAKKRSQFSKSYAYRTGPWADLLGHGSMAASIAAGTKESGGRYDGVAPDAFLLSARSTLQATDIFQLYDWVLARKRSGQIAGPIVMNNSYGLPICSAPAGLPEDHPYRGIILESIKEGMVVVFAAGNNHAAGVCGHDPKRCSPNTIWAVNSLDEVISVGAVNWDDRNDVGEHGNSSRGPGQWAKVHKKPDCVAPTYGEVVWGDSYRYLEWWGTSGACPLVSGLAALLLSAEPDLTPADIANIVRKSCAPLSQAHACVGAGRIDCEAAFARLGGANHAAVKKKAPKKHAPKHS